MKARGCLLVFARHPRIGQVKTRLASRVGAAAAADWYRLMVERTLTEARKTAADEDLLLAVGYAGSGRRLWRDWLGPDLAFFRQHGRSLGPRMENAFAWAFRRGFGRVVLVGTDIPSLTASSLREAFRGLIRHTLVLGPARDGGYYLLGLTRPQPALFHNVPWGTSSVLAETRKRAEQEKLETLLLKPYADIDRPEDLETWKRERTRRGHHPGGLGISIVIPSLNEEKQIRETLTAARQGASSEIILADGGSTDRTIARARAAGARIIRQTGGRGRQLNAGAARARGEIFLFLHADTRLPAGFDITVRHALSQPGVAAGAFRLRLDAPGRRYARIARWTNRRSRWLGLPYGDQALFMRREKFFAAGGFPDMPILEDLALVRRLRRLGRIVTVPAAVTTSARRWVRLGAWRTTFVNQGMLWGYFLGVDPNRLARWYRNQ